MNESYFKLEERLQEINLRIEREQYNPRGSNSEIKKLLKQKKQIEKQMKKIK